MTIENSSGTVAYSYTVGFDSNGNTTTITDGTNSTVVSTVTYGDPNDPFEPSRVQDGMGRVWQYTWDQYGNLLTTTTPRGVVTTNTYDYTHLLTGLLTSMQVGSLPATSTTYDPTLFDLLSVTSPVAGGSTATVSYTYDTLGNMLTATRPDASGTNRTTTFGYTADGTYTQTEALGQPITVTDPLANVTHLRYDSRGNVTSATDPLGSTTTSTFNIAGQTLTTTLPATGQTGSGQGYVQHTYQYPGASETDCKIYDESNNVVRNFTSTYGPAGEVLTETGGADSESFTYDAAYRTSTLTDGLGHQTTYTYTPAGYLASTTYAGGDEIQETSYNGAGQLLSETDPLGQVTNYVYSDPDGLVTAVQYPANTSQNLAYTYDNYGRLDEVAGPQDTTSYTLGNVGEALSKTVQFTGLPAVTLNYSYFADGSRSTIGTSVGSIGYGYDVLGRLASVTSPYSETFSWTYNNDSTVEAESLPNGASVLMTYNALKELTGLQNSVGTSIASQFTGLTYDGAGNLKTFTETNNAASAYSGTTSYTYDSTGQLTQETSTRLGGYTNNYAYDAAGNATTFRNASVSYNTKNQISSTGYSYDLDGGPTTYAGNALTFDNLERMTNFGPSMTAGYGSDGLRDWKSASGAQTYYIYDGTVPILELDSSGNVQAVTTAAGGTPLTRHTSAGSVLYAYDPMGGLAHRMDSSGNILSSHAFDAYGSASSTVSTTDPCVSFKAASGYRIDPETNLNLTGHRYYDPAIGRFVNRDPIGQEGGINQYKYCLNSPLAGSDPSGLETVMGEFPNETDRANYHYTSDHIVPMVADIPHDLTMWVWNGMTSGMTHDQQTAFATVLVTTITTAGLNAGECPGETFEGGDYTAVDTAGEITEQGATPFALGLNEDPYTRESLLQNFAEQRGFEYWGSPAYENMPWSEVVANKLLDPSVDIHVNLSGLDGTVIDKIKDGGRFGEELRMIRDNQYSGIITWWRNGTIIPPPQLNR